MKVFYKEANKNLNLLNCRFNGINIYIINNMVEYLEKSLAYNSTIQKELQKLNTTFKDLEENLTEEKSTDIQIKFKNYNNLANKQIETEAVINVIPSSMIVSLVSSFDYFIAKLIKLSYIYNPEIISAEKMNVSYQEIALLDSIDSVKNYYIDKIVDLQFRDSHKALFDYIEKTFSIKGIKDIEEYKNILLIAEMRNIIVHNDGYINVSFKNNLKTYGIKLDYDNMFNEDNKLNLRKVQNVEFIIKNLICFYIKLFYLFIYHFCKRNKDIVEDLSNKINELALGYYNINNFDVALELFNFMLKNSYKSSDKFMFTINKCMCLKALNKMEEVNKLLSNLDWSNCNDIYKFAKYLLIDDFENVYAYIKHNPEGMEYKFQFWPLCKPLIEKPEFIKLYNELYGKEFKYKIQSGNISKLEIKEVLKELKEIVKNSKLNNDDNLNGQDKNNTAETLKEEKQNESDDKGED